MGKVLMFLAPGFEEIEAVTIIDLLRRAEIEVLIAGLEPDRVTGSHGITISADAFYKDIDPNDFDYLIMPGGQPGTNNLKDDEKVLDMVRKFDKENKLIGAICAAPTVLHKAGILENKKVTSYPSEKNVFEISIYKENNIVRDENIITSRGVGTAIEFALELIGIIREDNIKRETAQRILWPLENTD